MPEDYMQANLSVSEWDDRWNVCHGRMDHEHRVLFGYFQEFEHLAGDTEANKDALRDVIMRFLSLASAHFVFEERVMGMSGMDWPDAKAHMDDHMMVQNLFLKVIGPVVRNSLDLPTYRQAFLDAFITHITTFDIPLAEHLKRVGEEFEK